MIGFRKFLISETRSPVGLVKKESGGLVPTPCGNGQRVPALDRPAANIRPITHEID